MWSAVAGVVAGALALALDPVGLAAASPGPVAIATNAGLGLAAAGAVAVVMAVRHQRQASHVQRELRRMTFYDTLTGLPCRVVFEPWLGESLLLARRTSSRLAVLFCDLDRYQQINDTYGHDVGDRLLVAVAARLRAALRPTDRLIRFDGPRFVAICPDIAGVTGAERVAEDVVAAFENPFPLDSDSIAVSVNVGVVVPNEHQTGADEVLQDAETAMYDARSHGHNTFATFDQAMRNNLIPSTAERRLREALHKGEFHLFYLPVVSLADQRMVGVEALIRWADPDRGLVPPGDFIPALEDTGLMVPVGNWVLHEAARQAKEWNDAFPQRIPLDMTVNVSARQLAQADFLDVLTAAITASGVEPGQLCLELTESALIYDVDAAWAVLRQAKSLGLNLALDDFGTGYSSLSFVRQFDLDALKIDRAFVEGLAADVHDSAIVSHVVGLAHDLGMLAVAVGVETAEQAVQLQRLGCDHGQGYFFNRPQPPGAIAQILQQETVTTDRGERAASSLVGA